MKLASAESGHWSVFPRTVYSDLRLLSRASSYGLSHLFPLRNLLTDVLGIEVAHLGQLFSLRRAGALRALSLQKFQLEILGAEYRDLLKATQASKPFPDECMALSSTASEGCAL